MQQLQERVSHHHESVGDVSLHWVEAGDGRPVVLLHGFPEFWYAWRYQIPALADAGYRAVAPDLRGYNGSDRPPEVDAYRLERLVEDVRGLVAALGEERVDLVGHDWGGALAWRVAATAPGLVRRLVVLNAPHPSALARELRRPRQILRSWYFLLFQIPWLPELMFRARDYEMVERVLRRDIRRRDVLSETEFGRYVEALSRPGALRGMINWYRAAGRSLLPGGRPPGPGSRVEVPTLVVWGERDRYLGPHLLDGLERWVPDVLIERIADAGHFVQVERWERVNRLLLWFLGAEGQPLPGATRATSDR